MKTNKARGSYCAIEATLRQIADDLDIDLEETIVRVSLKGADEALGSISVANAMRDVREYFANQTEVGDDK